MKVCITTGQNLKNLKIWSFQVYLKVSKIRTWINSLYIKFKRKMAVSMLGESLCVYTNQIFNDLFLKRSNCTIYYYIFVLID